MGLSANASSNTKHLYFRGITLQAESKKEYEEVKYSPASPFSSSTSGSLESSVSFLSLTVDLCNQQHLQADLSLRQSRGGYLLVLNCSFKFAVLVEHRAHSISARGKLYFIFLGCCNQVKSDSAAGSDPHHQLWEKTGNAVFQVTFLLLVLHIESDST